jgi:pimeloyl-ACP methyl ester carboxylesterase
LGCDLGVQSKTMSTGPSPAADAIQYRDDMPHHPGCTTDGLSYPAAQIPGYGCAAKEYAFPAGVTEDRSKPIVVLVHGNSSTPSDYEKFPADTGMPQLSERLVAAGFHTYAVDFRIDKNDDPQTNNTTENAARNIDHAWATPILEHMLSALFAAHPDRKITVVGFSLGTTVVRDTLRRLHNRGGDNVPWPHLKDVVLLSGANHGVSTFAKLCGSNPTMRGKVACQMGPRDNFVAPDFMKALNGTGGEWESPCSDGNSAYGQSGLCGGNHVRYLTVVMKDISDGSYQDEFVSEASTHLGGADNQTVSLQDFDTSNYFYNGLFKNHYGSLRSEAGLTIIMNKVQQ